DSMGTAYDDKFFVIHYKGSPAKSYISTFGVVEKGAAYKMVDNKEFFRGSNCVDIDFGPDGRLYLSEFNYSGWLNQGVGNIYTMEIPAEISKPEVAQNHKLMIADYSKMNPAKLRLLLNRDHMHIRQKAQFELAKRAAVGVEVFSKTALDKSASTFSRIHSIWGLSQMARKDNNLLKPLFSLINDKDDQVRIQTIRVLGDHRIKEAIHLYKKALNDKHSRVAMYAGIAIGRIADKSAVPHIFDVLVKNADNDLWLRHGMVMALAGIEKSAWLKGVNNSNRSIRMAVLLALRKSTDARLADFLADSDQKISYEAIRAINDLHIHSATAALAAQLDKISMPAANDKIGAFIIHRIINANFYEATKTSAQRLLKFAARSEVPERIRREALAAIEGWNDKHPIDTTTGLPRPIIKNRHNIKTVVQLGLPAVFKTASGKVLVQATRLADKFGYKLPNSALLKQLKDKSQSAEVRTAALDTLRNNKLAGLDKVLISLLKDKDELVRSKALAALIEVNAQVGLKALIKFTSSKHIADRQSAYFLLADQASTQAAAIIKKELSLIVKAKGNAQTMLDVLEAARQRPESDIKKLLAAYDKKMARATLTQKFAGSRLGGSVLRGKNILLNHGSAQCMRCHKINGFGADVGPDLSSIGKKYDSHYLLEAVVDPGATVAPGFGAISATLKNGTTVSGILMQETTQYISLKMADGKIEKHLLINIASRTKAISGMPPMHFLLNAREIRDAVAYLGSKKVS
ncbi:MAG: c-type cytochrome, partial [Lentisphaeraceae bacterium]|nr:c-type cytochrome [Lentisphaeraceae bacterium]